MSGSRLAPIRNVSLFRKLCARSLVLWLLIAGLCGAALAQTAQTTKPQTANEYLQRGNDHLNKSDYEKAIGDYTEALRLDPQLAKAYYNRALAHFNMKDFDKTIADSTQAIKINPRYADAYHHRGTAYGRTGRYDEALVDVNRAIKLNPRLAEPYFSRGTINSALGNNELAIADYSRAVELDPKMGKAYYNRGTSYFRKNDYDQAISDFTRTLSLLPGEASVYWSRGSVYAVKKEYDRALEDLTKAISLTPTDTQAYYKRAEVYCARGEKELAAADKSKIIELGGTVDHGCEDDDNPQPSLSVTSSTRRRFEDYPAQKFTGKPATPIIANQRGRLYRTMIRQDAQVGPNFAGHYTIARWGCGSTCIGFAIIDARTGRVYFHPQAFQVMQVPYQTEDVLQFRPDSRMLIISGEILPVQPDQSTGPESVGKFYYEWKGDRFTLLETVGIRREEGAPPLLPEMAQTGARSEAQLDDLCASLDNSYECAQAIERHQLQVTENAQRVKRKGGQLLLKLSNGRWHTIRDYQKANDEASTIKYNFREHLPAIGYFLVHRQFYEGRDYLMIDEGMGRRFELQAVPVVSPDKQRLVTTSNGIMGGYEPNAVQIWRLTKNGLVLEQTIKPRDWGPSDAVWIDNQTIRLTKNIPTADGSNTRTELVSLVLRGRWQMRSKAQ